MKFTVFEDRYGARADVRSASWGDFCDWIGRPDIYPDKASTPLVKCATFGDLRSENGSLRTNANMLSITGCEGDYDGEDMPMEVAAALLREGGVKGILYTSPSYTPDRPRWRVICPLRKPRDPSERLALVERLNGILKGVLSAESFTQSQAFHCGRVEGREFDVIRVS